MSGIGVHNEVTTIGDWFMGTKDEAKQIIDSLPDDARLDDIMHALYVAAKFDRGEREIRSGYGVSHKAAKRRLRRLLK